MDGWLCSGLCVSMCVCMYVKKVKKAMDGEARPGQSRLSFVGSLFG